MAVSGTVVALIAFVVGLTATASAQDVRVADPRPFGYFLGDILKRSIEIDGPPGDVLIASSLPVPGPATYWLDVRDVSSRSESAGGGMRHTVLIEYQLFYAAIDPRALTIPGRTIALEAGGVRRTVDIPPLTLTVSPLREIFPDQTTSRQATLLRPDALPQLAALGPWQTAAAWSAAVAGFGLVLLAHHRGWPPFSRRTARPFTRASAEIRTLLARRAGPDDYSAALTVLHRAFDIRAGRRLLADDLPAFLRACREHAPSSEDIGRFFETSRRVFFASDLDDGRRRLPDSHLVRLAHDLAAQERTVR